MSRQTLRPTAWRYALLHFGSTEGAPPTVIARD
jgi:hypothetical protein